MKTDIWKTNRERGSLSVEASIAILVFVVAMGSLLMLLSDLGYREKVHQTLYETVQQMTLVDMQSNAECFGLASAMVLLKHPKDTKNLQVSQAALAKDGTFTIELSWRNRLPVGSTFKQCCQLTGRVLNRGFDGISNVQNIEVYVTNTGKKYHLKGCNHLRLSSQPIPRSEAIKNGYEPCWHCVGGLKPFEEAPGKLGD